MTEVDSLKERNHNSLRLGGNLSVIVVSTAFKSFGGGLINSYISLYFVELGGSPFSFGLTAALASLTGCIMFLVGGFLFEVVDPTLPFYMFSIAEIIAAVFLVSFVREPQKKEP